LLAQPELEFDPKNRGGNMTEHVREANKKKWILYRSGHHASTIQHLLKKKRR
jgi:hypothetical protein